MAVASEGLSFLLGELPHVRGRAELRFQDEKKADVEKIVGSIRGALAAHRDELYARIEGEISGAFKGYLGQSEPDLLLWADPCVEVKVVLDEIKDVLPRERVNLIFQEAFNTSATALENFVIGFIHTITKEKAEMYFARNRRRVRELKEISNSIGELDIPEQSKGIRKRIKTLLDQFTIKFQL